ncbi:unnamed protein product [Prorocentrum cordatum]|uniref:Uncharacterized protein n=1 Tax=Prorocentrum cordatum TaxID=2364126 RepID=A0ABN9R708_9DINO|nr:unnamed protein product [Polarella glacialis]
MRAGSCDQNHLPPHASVEMLCRRVAQITDKCEGDPARPKWHGVDHKMGSSEPMGIVDPVLKSSLARYNEKNIGLEKVKNSVRGLSARGPIVCHAAAGPEAMVGQRALGIRRAAPAPGEKSSELPPLPRRRRRNHDLDAPCRTCCLRGACSLRETTGLSLVFLSPPSSSAPALPLLPHGVSVAAGPVDGGGSSARLTLRSMLLLGCNAAALRLGRGALVSLWGRRRASCQLSRRCRRLT